MSFFRWCTWFFFSTEHVLYIYECVKVNRNSSPLTLTQFNLKSSTLSVCIYCDDPKWDLLNIKVSSKHIFVSLSRLHDKWLEHEWRNMIRQPAYISKPIENSNRKSWRKRNGGPCFNVFVSICSYDFSHVKCKRFCKSTYFKDLKFF